MHQENHSPTPVEVGSHTLLCPRPAAPDPHMQRLLARRLSVFAMAGTGSSGSALPQLERFERALSSVDIAVEPRVQLVPPAVGGGEWPLPLDESVAVLDSSFNPPTCAHVHLLRSAAARFGVCRRMLLLAKQNADKPVVGASLPHRLQMMELLAREEVEGSTVCGVTAHPLFVDKARALRALCGPGATIFLLVGYDTWERVVDPKYYPEGRRDDALRSLFGTVEAVSLSRDSPRLDVSVTRPRPVTGGRHLSRLGKRVDDGPRPQR